jgi:hypothetical protein
MLLEKYRGIVFEQRIHIRTKKENTMTKRDRLSLLMAALILSMGCVPTSVVAQQPQLPELPGEIAPPPPDPEPPAVGPYAPAPVNFLEVYWSTGVHLQATQKILLVGPIGPWRLYLVNPLHDPSLPDHAWQDGPYWATDISHPFPPGTIYSLNPVGVRDPVQHPTEVSHPVTMTIVTSDENGPTYVVFATPNHSGTGGSHGGSAGAGR